MKFKLLDVFTAMPLNRVSSLQELYALKLHPDFIQKLATLYGLSFEAEPPLDTNVCFSKSKDIRPEYRSTFNKQDVLEIVYPQVQGQTVSPEWDELVFPQKAASFFSTSYKKSIPIKTQKRRLRKTMLEQRDKMPYTERKTYSEKICENLWDLILKKKVRVIHSYLTMGSEVNVLPLLQKALDHGLTVTVPKTLRKRQMQNLKLNTLKDMEAGIFNTYHPKNGTPYTGSYDLIIVAGLAFDTKGFRVGYGGGYYDTFLADQDAALKVGVCYPFQIIDSLPHEDHDIQVNILVS